MTKDWLERILSDQERAEEEEWQQFYAQFQRDAQRWHENLTGKVER